MRRPAKTVLTLLQLNCNKVSVKQPIKIKLLIQIMLLRFLIEFKYLDQPIRFKFKVIPRKFKMFKVNLKVKQQFLSTIKIISLIIKVNLRKIIIISQ